MGTFETLRDALETVNRREVTEACDGQFRYATDGYFALREAVPEGSTVVNPDFQKKVIELNKILAASGPEATIPDIQPQEVIACLHCAGSGKVVDCIHCAGSGEHECECGDSHACGYCMGRGNFPYTGTQKNTITCDDCNGAGKIVLTDERTAIADAHFTRAMLYPLYHAGCRAAKVVTTDGFHHVAIISIDGVIALIAGRS